MDLVVMVDQGDRPDRVDTAAGTTRLPRETCRMGAAGQTLRVVLDLLAQEDLLAERSEEDRCLAPGQAQTSRST